jgi:hypothetical protein
MKIADDEYNSAVARWQDQVHKSNKNGVWVEMATTGSHIEESHLRPAFATSTQSMKAAGSSHLLEWKRCGHIFRANRTFSSRGIVGHHQEFR